eukprot:TRINITY_DN11621_c0_g1_i1.p1 TRINITY_DN11621_c0_g1~~TRINITY_DN11621_c0_g1_i1.p1  ORF type:complete len:409 (+),score=96.13 TRINITY_DN11621_c0_g1_i1:47-1273(+)
MSDAVELVKKLEEHKQQLVQVEKLLKEAPSDETVKRLHADLLKVVGLEEDLIKIKSTADSLPTTQTATSTETKQEQETNNQGDSKESKEVSQDPLSSSSSTSSRKFKVGDRCQAKWQDQKYYTARVDSLTEMGTYMVTYLDYGTQDEAAEDSLIPYESAPFHKLIKGAKVRIISPDDGLLHDGIIDSISTTSPNKFVVNMKVNLKKKVKLEVPANDIIMRPGLLVTDTTAIPDQFTIPDMLKINSDDTERVKQQKQKRIKRLKTEYRRAKLEKEGKQRQNAWQQFQSKGVKRKSMFASPDTVEGKVGVIGSGKAMTDYVDPSKLKLKRNLAQSAASGSEEDENASSTTSSLSSSSSSSSISLPPTSTSLYLPPPLPSSSSTVSTVPIPTPQSLALAAISQFLRAPPKT